MADAAVTAASFASIPTKESAVLKGHEGAILSVRFNHDGKYCLTAGKDRSIRLWNPHKGLAIKSYLGHGHEVRDVAAASDNGRLASCGGDKQVFLWDVSTGRVIRRFRGHDSEVNAVCFNDESSVVLSAGYDRSIRVWDCRSQSANAVQSLEHFGDSVTSIALTKSEIVGGSVDGTVRTFDIRHGRVTSDHLGQPVTCISLSNDGNCILAGCLDSTLRLIDRASGDVLNEYRGHTNKSYKLGSCFSNDDAVVLSGSEDGQVFCWDLVEEATRTAFQAHTGTVTGLAFHTAEACLLTCSVDGTAKVWKT